MLADAYDVPHVPYQPKLPPGFDPGIVLVGCGGIAVEHLTAYRHGGLTVQGLVDIRPELAEQARRNYFPEAKVFASYREALQNCDAAVFDVATHPDVRPSIIRDVLNSGRHVLSQKPFVLDLDEGERLIELAEQRGLCLAVNQNGRWAPHFCYLREAVRQGLVGQTCTVNMSVAWDHRWVAGTKFEQMRHLILYDFAIHWFDMVRCLIPHSKPVTLFARAATAVGQQLRPPLLANAVIEFENALATLQFNGHALFQPHDQTTVVGTAGTLTSEGPSLQEQQVRVANAHGSFSPQLQGKWFPDGFLGTMGELLSSVYEGRACEISARDNLHSLALCFAAVASADLGKPCRPGEVRQIGNLYFDAI